MASVTVSASAARVLAPASKARISAKSLGASASSARGVAVAARLPARSARKSRALTITAAGLPPNLAGMMGNMDPEKLKEIQAAYEQAMKDPETAKKVPVAAKKKLRQTARSHRSQRFKRRAGFASRRWPGLRPWRR